MVKKTLKSKVKTKKVEEKSTQEFKTLSKDDFYKYAKFVIPVLLILFAMWFAFDVRSGSINLDGLDAQVEQSIYSNVEQIILQDIASKYPNLNEVYLQDMASKEFAKVLETGVLEAQGQQFVIDDLIKQQQAQVKQQFQTDDGQTYLTAIDPYFFYRKSLNLVETGTTGDKLIDGVGYETHKLSPEITEAKKEELHMWLGAKLIGDENKSLGEQFSAIFILSAILAALAVIPLYLLMRLYTNDVIAFFTSLLLVSIGVFVSRTVTGFFDTDAYNVLFPLLIVAGIVYSLKTKSKILTTLYGIVAGIFMGLFVWAWATAWFIFVFILAAFIGYTLYVIISSLFAKIKLKELTSTFINEAIAIGSFLISSIVFTYVFTKQFLITSLIEGLFASLNRLASSDTGNIWPNVLTTVAELNPASFAQIVSGVGGVIVFIVALIGLLMLALDFEFKKDNLKSLKFLLPIVGIIWFIMMTTMETLIALTVNSPFIYLVLLFLPIGLALIVGILNGNTSSKIFLVMLVSAWFAGTVFMSLNGVRFILLLAPAAAIAFGFGLYYIAQTINTLLQKEFSIQKPVLKQLFGIVAVSILFLFIFNPMATQAKQIGDSATPNFDDAWYSSMDVIQQNTSEDAIITSWWDFGHFFAAIADRGVTFDGATQTTPQSHWVGLLLMESDEEVSRDILRMLTCGGNKAFDTMQEISNDTTGGVHLVNLIKTTLGKDKEETRSLIESYEKHSFTQTQVDEIMNYLSCENPRENILITSGDMVGKAAVWAHWGSWDFNKKYVLDNQELGAEQLANNLDLDQAIVQQYLTELTNIRNQARVQNTRQQDLINQWLAPYPGFAGNSQCQTQDNQTLVCQNGIRIDMNSGEVLNKDQFQGASFARVILPGMNNNLEIVKQQEGGMLDVLLIPSQDQFSMVLAQYPLGTSLFSKLFYLQGYGTNYFDLLDARQTQTAGNLFVWRTNFEKQVEPQLNVGNVEYTITQEELEEMLANQELELNFDEEVNSSN